MPKCNGKICAIFCFASKSKMAASSKNSSTPSGEATSFPAKISQPVISDQLQYQNLHEAWTYSHSLLLYESYLLQYNIDVFHHVLPVESLQQAKMYLPPLLLLCLTLLFHLLRDERKNRVRTILFGCFKCHIFLFFFILLQMFYLNSTTEFS